MYYVLYIIFIAYNITLYIYIYVYISQVTHPLSSADISVLHFFTRNQQFCYMVKYSYRLHFDT